jgi:hypothetical protein
MDLARKWLQDRPCLLVGCDPAEDSDLERYLYGTLLVWLGGFSPDSCLVWPQPAGGDISRWASRNVTLVDAEPVGFLRQLKEGLQGQEIELAKSEERAALENLVRMLRGQPQAEQVAVAAQVIPSRQRPRSIRLTLTFRLSKEDTLRSAVDLEYLPDIAPFHRGEFRDTGISLEQLETWTGHADRCRRGGILPEEYPIVDESGQQQSLVDWGIDFLAKILPADSGERAAYARALELSLILRSSLQIVFQPLDSLGRLSPVPWELLHDGFVHVRDNLAGSDGRLGTLGRGFLALKYPVCRRLPGFTSLEQASGRIRQALIVAADRYKSKESKRLKGLDGEVEKIADMLRPLGVQVTVLSTGHPALSDPEAIKRRIREEGTHLLHFAGHGQFNPYDPAQSKLLLGRDLDESDRALTATELAEVARDSELVLVFMSACEVGMPAEIAESQPWKEAGFVDAFARAGVPATVGMRWKIGNENSHEVARTFYKSLLQDGQPAEQALKIARQAVGDQPDWANPILTKRHGLLDGQI